MASLTEIMLGGEYTEAAILKVKKALEEQALNYRNLCRALALPLKKPVSSSVAYCWSKKDLWTSCYKKAEQNWTRAQQR